jgi:CTP:molybdopterin cytidylyltransferase MocA
MTQSARTIADTVAVAVLAAGSATRFGGGKLDASLRGKPLGRWATDAVEATGAVSRFLILGPDRPAFAAALDGWTIIENRDADQGIGTSIHAAAKAAASFARLVIVLADMPFVTPGHLAILARADRMTFTRHADGSAGVPAGFPQAMFRQLRAIPPGRGAAGLAVLADADVVDPCDSKILCDVDSPTDLTVS